MTDAILGVKNTIAVASGKGGVGKSTVAASLALALRDAGARVALVDADIYGPNIPHLLNISEVELRRTEQGAMLPVPAFGLQTMSIAYLLPQDDTPVVWRGPIATRTLQQLLRQTIWEDVDYLIIDMPPGTGDIQISLVQQLPLTGAVIVTTPQEMAVADASKALQLFNKVRVPVLGIIENMSVHVCEKCSHSQAIFDVGGGETLSQRYDIECLGQIPLALSIRESIKQGCAPEIFSGIAAKIHQKIMALNQQTSKFPKIVVEYT